MKINKKQRERIKSMLNHYGECNNLFGYFFDKDININYLLEDFVTDRFLISENGEIETIINTPESYFDMLIDFLEYLNDYYDKLSKN